MFTLHEKFSIMKQEDCQCCQFLLVHMFTFLHVHCTCTCSISYLFSTLSQLDEPYPMLVLCGPACSGKEAYAQQLVEEFPSFFGLGFVRCGIEEMILIDFLIVILRVSHTTRPQGADESHGRDYYFINDTTFKRAVDAVRMLI